MARLVVRNVDEQVENALRKQAAQNGRSVEDDHRAILRRALIERNADFKAHLLAMPDVGDDADFERS